ncbi:MAG: sugar phosphate isomerase/epimerase [Fibrobacteres bacterium]|nr:sugar phosphate isomerase/epimerase [Fibrobacterota bacterium]
MLCYSTGSLPDALSLPAISDLLTNTPFTGVELTVTPPMLARAADAAYWKGIRDLYREKGLAFRNVHLGAPHLLGPEPHRPGLASLDPADRAAKAAACQACMGIAVALGSPHLTITSGLTESEATHARQEAAFREALAGLVAIKPAALKLLIEQEPEHVIRSVEQLDALCLAFPGEVFATFDVGHSAVMGEDIAACIHRLGPLLRNLHLEDIRGRVHAHKLYGEGDIDFAPVFRALREIGYHGDFTPDLYPFKDEPHRAMAASEEFLRSHGVLTRAL